RLAAILRFYLRRAVQHGWIKSNEKQNEIEETINRLEVSGLDLKTEQWGFIVNLAGRPQKETPVRDCRVRFLTAADFRDAGLATSQPPSDGASTESDASEGGDAGARRPEPAARPVTPQPAPAAVEPVDAGGSKSAAEQP